MIAFSRVPGTRLYQRQAPPTGPGWLGFLLTAPGTEPDQIPIAEAWSDPQRLGYFVFLAETPPDAAAFAAALEAYRQRAPDNLPDPLHASFAWVAYDKTAAVVSTAYVLRLVPGDPDPVVAGSVRFPFANYGLPFEAATQTTALAATGSIDGFRI